MATPATYKGVLKEFDAHSQEVRDYFEHLPRLVNDFGYDVAIAYVHSQVELGHNFLLYCGLAKLHKADVAVADRIIQATHITREGFQEFFEHVFGKPIPTTTQKQLENAEHVRDKIMHGKSISEEKKRGALVDVLSYAAAMNIFVKGISGFSPFGQDLRGFKGAGKSIDPATTKWLMKGMGFAAS